MKEEIQESYSGICWSDGTAYDGEHGYDDLYDNCSGSGSGNGSGFDDGSGYGAASGYGSYSYGGTGYGLST